MKRKEISEEKKRTLFKLSTSYYYFLGAGFALLSTSFINTIIAIILSFLQVPNFSLGMMFVSCASLITSLLMFREANEAKKNFREELQ